MKLAVCLAVLIPFAAHAQWTPQYEAGIVHDSNFSRAQREQDVVSDTALTLRAAVDRGIGDAAVGADAKLVRFTRSHGASFGAAGVNAGWRTKLGLGRTAPWIAADASAAVEDAREDVRDAVRGSLSLAAGRRFGERLSASTGLAYDRRVQREDQPTVARYSGKPFSIRGRSLFARAGFALGGGVELTGSLALRRGDVESSTRRNSAIFAASNAIAPDRALGPDFVAYRLSGARTRTVSAGVSWELTRRSLLEATLAREDTHVGAGLSYDSMVFGVSFVHRR